MADTGGADASGEFKLINVLKLNLQNRIEKLTEMWFHIFLWYLVSSLIVHLAAALIGVWALRRHKVARLYPVLIVIMGVLGPATGGLITSFLIATLFKVAQIEMYPLWALVIGCGQTIVVVLISFSRLLATL